MTAPAAVGIDVGGTKCLGIALDHDGHVVAEHRVPTPDTPEALVATLADIAATLGADGAAGVAVPGLVNRDGVLLAAANLRGVKMLALRDELEARTDLRWSVDNDNTVACLAEWRFGAGRGVDDLLLVGLGTGIGGGFVCGGVLQRGCHGFAGEFGHMIVQAHGISCPCGQQGCWERYASGSSLAMHARDAAGAGRLDAVVSRAGGIDELRGEHITDAALAGDPDALAVIDTFADWVAIGLVNLTNTFDPGAIVISGGLSAAPELFLPPIEQAFHASMYGGDDRPWPRLAFAELGPLAGGIGAALLTTL
ncbi:MAG: ROK family protein [Acidimicrobiales bacterium]|nr:ROK family protein [Acidimicrobiales bacterium]MCB9394416.1 ROK family protein [Acidimicrobiaceae bacterium]